MEYISLSKPNGNAICTDPNCPCTKQPLSMEAAFLYVSSQQVTEWRRNPDGALSSPPLLLCRAAARRRALDLETAAADAVHWWNTGSIALRASPRRELKFKDFDGHTVEVAEENARAQIGEDLIGTDIVRDVQETTTTAQGGTADAALATVMERLPAVAFGVGPARIIQEGQRGAVTVSEFEESAARRAWRRQAPRGAELVKLEMQEAPKKGIAGLGRKPGTWVAEWAAPFYAEVTYKMPAVVQARFFG